MLFFSSPPQYMLAARDGVLHRPRGASMYPKSGTVYPKVEHIILFGLQRARDLAPYRVCAAFT